MRHSLTEAFRELLRYIYTRRFSRYTIHQFPTNFRRERERRHSQISSHHHFTKCSHTITLFLVPIQISENSKRLMGLMLKQEHYSRTSTKINLVREHLRDISIILEHSQISRNIVPSRANTLPKTEKRYFCKLWMRLMLKAPPYRLMDHGIRSHTTPVFHKP